MFSIICYFSLNVHLPPQNGHCFRLLSINPRLVRTMNSCRLRSLHETVPSPSKCQSTSEQSVAGERKHSILSSWPLLKGYGTATRVLNTKRAIILLEPWKQMVFQKRGTVCSYSLQWGQTTGSEARASASPVPVSGRITLQPLTAGKDSNCENPQTLCNPLQKEGEMPTFNLDTKWTRVLEGLTPQVPVRRRSGILCGGILCGLSFGRGEAKNSFRWSKPPARETFTP